MVIRMFVSSRAQVRSTGMLPESVGVSVRVRTLKSPNEGDSWMELGVGETLVSLGGEKSPSQT